MHDNQLLNSLKPYGVRVYVVVPILSHGSHGSTTARSYGYYDINGFWFHSTKFEAKNPHAATTNNGVVTTASASEGSITEYFGVIQNIVELKFEGSKGLRI
jgi:hypothetical protein